MPVVVSFPDIVATLRELQALVERELEQARAQTERLSALDADASLAYARARTEFTDALAEANARLTEQVQAASRALGMTSFDPAEIERRHPGAGQPLLLAARALAEAASALRRQDALNLQLAGRARACVTAWLHALTGSPAAYNRRGQVRELPVFSTSGRVA